MTNKCMKIPAGYPGRSSERQIGRKNNENFINFNPPESNRCESEEMKKDGVEAGAGGGGTPATVRVNKNRLQSTSAVSQDVQSTTGGQPMGSQSRSPPANIVSKPNLKIKGIATAQVPIQQNFILASGGPAQATSKIVVSELGGKNPNANHRMQHLGQKKAPKKQQIPTNSTYDQLFHSGSSPQMA